MFYIHVLCYHFLLPGIHPANIAPTPLHNLIIPSCRTILFAQLIVLKGLFDPHFSHWILVFNVSKGNITTCSAKPAKLLMNYIHIIVIAFKIYYLPANMWSRKLSMEGSHSCHSSKSPSICECNVPAPVRMNEWMKVNKNNPNKFSGEEQVAGWYFCWVVWFFLR